MAGQNNTDENGEGDVTYEEWIAGGNQIKAELDRVDAELQEVEFRLKLAKHKCDLDAAAIIEEERNQCLQEWQSLVLKLRDHKEIRPPKISNSVGLEKDRRNDDR